MLIAKNILQTRLSYSFRSDQNLDRCSLFLTHLPWQFFNKYDFRMFLYVYGLLKLVAVA